MVLFSGKNCIEICLKNNNPYVALAVEDLRRDFLAVSRLQNAPVLIKKENENCLIIEDNQTDGDPLLDESFVITCKNGKITISANTYLGTMWGIYTFSEKVLGVAPCCRFNDLAIEKRDTLTIDDFCLKDGPSRKGFRGIFINDEDLLTGWKESGGVRHMDYPFYGTTVAESVMDRVVETALRLKLNLVIPASFLDIDNPPEKVLADCVAKRGIFLSQHHLEPLGLSHFTYENYCKKFQKSGGYSYINNPDVLKEAWEYYAGKWAEYDNVVWQLGLRGKADRPLWEEDTPTERELKTYADYISNAMKEQKEIVLRATNGRAKYFSTTLWMEGSMLAEKGLLRLDTDTIIVFADNGPNQMFGKDYDRVPREKNYQYGIYYHVQYYDIGPHLVPQTGLDKLYHNLHRTKQKGDDSYYILNVSNVREFVFELHAYGEMLWDFSAFDKEKYLEKHCQRYGKEAKQAKAYIQSFYNNLPTLPTEWLRYVHANYFNYDYDEVSPGIKNFILKDGLIAARGSDITWHFYEDLPMPLYGQMYAELKKTLPTYEKLATDLEKWSASLDSELKKHVQCKWWLYTKTLEHIYRWFIYLYEGKLRRDEGDTFGMQSSIKAACESLEQYLSLRGCAEYGEFANWYRGEVKLNIIRRLSQTKAVLDGKRQ